VNKQLTWREKISYGIADMGFNFYWTNIATFLLIFYTDVFGISAAAAASMVFDDEDHQRFHRPDDRRRRRPHQHPLRQVPALT
jgi:hypothetical protein